MAAVGIRDGEKRPVFRGVHALVCVCVCVFVCGECSWSWETRRMRCQALATCTHRKSPQNSSGAIMVTNVRTVLLQRAGVVEN